MASFEKSAAMLTAANVTAQNVSKSSTALRTIIARLRKMDTELDELGEVMTTAQYDELTKALTDQGVSLVDEYTGELRDAYDVLRDMSVAWQDMSANERSALAQTFGSTRNQNIFISLMENFGEAEEAMNSMQDSANALSDANNTYLESIKAHVQQFKNAFDTMLYSDSMVSFINDIVDLGKGIIEFIGKVADFIDMFGGFRAVLSVIAPLLLSIFSSQIANSIMRMGNNIRNMSYLFSSLRTQVQGYATSQNVANTAMSTGAKAATTLSTALGAIGMAMATANLVVSAVQGIISLFSNKSSNKDIEVLDNDELKQNSDNLMNLYKQYDELSSKIALTSDEKENLISVTDQLSSSLGIEIDAVDKASGSMAKYKESITDAIIEQQNLMIAQAKLNADNAKSGISSWYDDKRSAFVQHYAEAGYIYVPSQMEAEIKLNKENTEEYEKQVSLLKEAGFIITHDLNGNEFVNFGTISRDNTDSMEAYARSIKRAIDLLSTTDVNSGLYQSLLSEYSHFSSWIEQLDESNELIANLNSSNALIKTMNSGEYDFYHMTKDEMSEFRQEVINTALTMASENSNVSLGIDEITNSVDNLLSHYSEFSDYYGNTSQSIAKQTSETVSTIKTIINDLKSEIGDNNFVGAIFSEPVKQLSEYNQELTELGNAYNELVNGNVDYNLRPLLDASTMVAAGWEEAADSVGEAITTFTQGYNTSDFDIDTDIPISFDITPILQDGSVLSPESLENYILSLDLTDGVDALLESDYLNLIVHTHVEPEWDKEYWASFEERLDSIKDAYEDVRNSSSELKEDLIQTFSNEDDTVAINFTPYVLDTYGRKVRVLGKKELEQYAKDVISGVKEDELNLIVGTKIELDDGGAFAQAQGIRDNLVKMLSDFSIQFDGTKYAELINTLTAVDNATNAASKALDKLNEALKEPSYGEGLDARAENYLKMVEAYENGEIGDTAFRAYAEYFGIALENADGTYKTYEQIGEEIKALAKYTGAYYDEEGKLQSDADLGMLRFLDDVEALGEEYDDLIKFTKTVEGDDMLWFDPSILFDESKMDQLTSKFGITSEFFIDLLNNYRKFSLDWQSYTAEDLDGALREADLLQDVGDDTILYVGKLEQLLEALGFDYNVIQEIVDKAGELSTIDVGFNYTGEETAEQIKGDILSLVENLQSAGINSDELVSNIAQALATVNSEVREQMLGYISEAYGEEFGQQVSDVLASFNTGVDVDATEDSGDNLETIHTLITDIDGEHDVTFNIKADGIKELAEDIQFILDAVGDNGSVSFDVQAEEPFVPFGSTGTLWNDLGSGGKAGVLAKQAVDDGLSVLANQGVTDDSKFVLTASIKISEESQEEVADVVSDIALGLSEISEDNPIILEYSSVNDANETIEHTIVLLDRINGQTIAIKTNDQYLEQTGNTIESLGKKVEESFTTPVSIKIDESELQEARGEIDGGDGIVDAILKVGDVEGKISFTDEELKDPEKRLTVIREWLQETYGLKVEDDPEGLDTLASLINGYLQEWFDPEHKLKLGADPEKAEADIDGFVEDTEDGRVITLTSESDTTPAKDDVVAFITNTDGKTATISIAGQNDKNNSVEDIADEATAYVESQHPQLPIKPNRTKFGEELDSLKDDIENGDPIEVPIVFTDSSTDKSTFDTNPDMGGQYNSEGNLYYDESNSDSWSTYSADVVITNTEEVTSDIEDAIDNANTEITIETPDDAFNGVSDSVREITNAVGGGKTVIEKYSQTISDSSQETERLSKEMDDISRNVVDTSRSESNIDKISTASKNASDELKSIISTSDQVSKTQINTSNKTNALSNMINVVQRLIDSMSRLLDSIRTYNSTQLQDKTTTITTINKGGTVPISASAKGTRNAKGGPTLLGDEFNEAGRPRPELVVSDGEAYIAGVNGPTLANLKAGDVVYPYDETKKILAGSKITKFQAFAGGTIDYEKIYKNVLNRTGLSGINSYNDNSTTNNTYNYNAGSSSTSGDTEYDWVDHIETVLDRAERAVSDFKKVAESTYKSISERLKATGNEISAITNEITLQEQAYYRYMQQANSVGLDESLAKLVRDGTIDIRLYDDATRELISDYSQWYSKALDCADSISELHDNLSALYEDIFELKQQNYESNIELLTEKTNEYTNSLDVLNTKITSVLPTLHREMYDLYNTLEAIMSDPNSGIDVGSESWNNMQKEILSTRNEIVAEYKGIFDDVENAYQTSIDQFSRNVDSTVNTSVVIQKRQSTGIKQLINELEALQKTEDRVTEFTPAKTLQFGDVGDDVKKLQQSLKDLGFNVGSIDGIFGKMTDAAVRAFQSYNGLYVDGIVGPQTISQLNKVLPKIEEGSEAWNEMEEAIYNNKQAIVSYAKETFDLIQSGTGNQQELLSHLSNSYNTALDNLEAQGYLASSNYYKAMRKVELENNKLLQKELTNLKKAFQDAMDTGLIKEGSEEWYYYVHAIDNVKEALGESDGKLIELNNDIRNMDWSYFDYLQERISAVTDETSFLIDLLSNSELFTDNGQLTNEGMATMGLHTENYDVYMAQATMYANEMKNINAKLAKDPNNTELIKRREELLKLQQQSITSAEKEKQAVKSLVEEGINKELDSLKELIDTYKDNLNSAKSLYEYQKRIADQTKNITKLEKQLAAYTNDNSEETRATVQKLKVQLEDAQENLRESEYDRYIDDQGKMLDNLYDEYSDLLNERLDDVNKLMSDMIQLVNANTTGIGNTLDMLTDKVGYAIDYNVWGDSKAVSAYNASFLTNQTTTNTLLYGILSKVTDMIKGSNNIANNDISGIVQFASGGLANFTGLARLDGSPSRPELVLNPSDTQAFLALRDTLRDMSSPLNMLNGTGVPKFNGGALSTSNINTIGDINIVIEHVDDYTDFVTQLQQDRNFEKMIQAMTTDRLAGKSQLAKRSISFR